jgi:hypothetical protein
VAIFKILSTRRCGLETSEFDIQIISGFPERLEIFTCDDNGSPYEYVIKELSQQEHCSTLLCINWVLFNDHHSGIVVESRPMKAAERRRYRNL